jgi:PAN domain
MWRALILPVFAGAFLAITPTLAPAQMTFEVNIDRPGSDFTSFDLGSASARSCQRACIRDDGCRAWTYVRPGYQGAAPRCWLKGAIPAGTPNPCCISGIVR